MTCPRQSVAIRGPARGARLAVLLLVGPVLAVACGEDRSAGGIAETTQSEAVNDDTTADDPETEGGIVDVCAFLTDGELEVATGYAVASRTAGSQFGIFADGCRWVFDDVYLGVAPELVVGVMGDGGADYYARYFEPFIEENGDEVISGVGDAALGQQFGGVLVLSGDVLMSVQYLDERPDAAADDLAIVDLLLRAL